MELFITRIKTKTGFEYVNKKLSLFGDEEIELTKNWNDQQIISGYGSWSKTFSIPIDYNNSDVFKFYDIIGSGIINYTTTSSTELDPNYFLGAKIVINDYEIYGNIQVVGFSLKDMQPYSYQVVFFGGEKDLLIGMNASNYPTLNDIDTTTLEFTFTKENVINTWTGDTICYVPLFSIKRPLSYRDYELSGNTNSHYSDGFRMSDLAVGYNFKHILNLLFNRITIDNVPLRLTHSSGVDQFLKDLYIMPNTKIENSSFITYIYTKNVGSTGVLALQPGPTTTTGVLVGNTDLNSYNNITGYTNSNNTYTAGSTNTYKISVDFDASGNGLYLISKFLYVFVQVIDTATNLTVAKGTSKLDKAVIDIETVLNIGQNVKITICYVLYNHTYNYVVYTNNVLFLDKSVSAKVKITKISDEAYGFKKSIVNFPSDVLLSDFFVNFCKSFNIFFRYDVAPGGSSKSIITYFKDELMSRESKQYDLTKYLLLDKNYTFNHQQNYKLIDYQFAEPKDINNLAWKQGINTSTLVSNGLWYGQNKIYYNYDVGLEKLEYKSIFTVFPRTTLNRTDADNIIIEDTGIPLHSELNESFSPLNTDYLLMYKNPIVTGLTSTYNLQTSGNTFDVMDYAPDYGPDGSNGYSLDYIQLPQVIKDNTVKRYESTLEFLLPTDILYKINVYDTILVQGVYYEILDINMNIRNGYTKITVQTSPINTVKQTPITPVVPVVTETTTRPPCTGTLKLTITELQTSFDNDNITYVYIEKNGVFLYSGDTYTYPNPVRLDFTYNYGDLITATVNHDCGTLDPGYIVDIRASFLSYNISGTLEPWINVKELCPITELHTSGYTYGPVSYLQIYNGGTPTTTTTTTLTGYTWYKYSVEIYTCACSLYATMQIGNRTTLTLNKWYYDSVTGKKLYTTTYNGTSQESLPSSWTILDSSKKDSCAEVIGCPTTTTTTLAPTTTTTTTCTNVPGVPGVISGTAAVCVGSNNIYYTVPVISGATGYEWTTPSGSTITYDGGNTIGISYSLSAVTGTVTVCGTNICGKGQISSFSVTVYQLPGVPEAISGAVAVCVGSNNIYFTMPIPNVTAYSWTVPSGATIIAGATTNSIVVNFSMSASSGDITVKGTNSCGNGPTTSKSITVYSCTTTTTTT